MSRQNDAAAVIDGCLNSGNVHIGVAHANHNYGLRSQRPSENGDVAEHGNQSY
jgi:hypothetical protein